MKLLNYIIIFCVLGSYSLNTQIQPKTIETREFSQNFYEKYKTNRYNYLNRKERQGTLNDQRGQHEKNSSQKKYDPNDIKENKNFSWDFNFKGLELLFYIILLISLGIVIYFILGRKKGFNSFFNFEKHKNIDVPIQELNQHISQLDLQTLIKQCETKQDFRLAVRYYYWLILKQLSVQQYITMEDDKTSSDYLNELNDKYLQTGLKKTAHVYANVWYGEHHIDKAIYVDLKIYFDYFLKQLKT